MNITSRAVGQWLRKIGKETEMSSCQRFAIGGIGGLLPLVVSFLSFDPATVIAYLGALPLGIYIGYAIKTFVLFALGGTIAVLSDSRTPWTLVQLGIAAPALITSFINGAAVSGPTENARHPNSSLAVISSAYAAEVSGEVPIISAGFLGDVVRGATVPLPKIQREQQEQQQQQPKQQQQQRAPQQSPQQRQPQ
jgi:hypothetical protein